MVATRDEPSPCRGRAAELALLAEVVRGAGDGRFGGVVVEGEPGIGKSRLLAEALASAASSHCSVVQGRADELERTRPFGVLVDALGCTPSSPDPQRAGIADLLSTRQGEHGTVTVTSDPGLQFQVVDRFVDLVEALAMSAPLVIGLDDLQWADPASLRTLGAMSRRLTYVPIALLIGVRPEPRPEAVQHLLATLESAGVRRTSLGPLRESDVAELVADVAGGQPGPHLLEQVAAAGGHPLFVRELVQAMVDAGAVTRADGQAEVAASVSPPDLRLTILQRLSFLSADTLGLLRSASVLGGAFPLSDLSTLVSRSAVELTQALEGAFRAGVLVDDGDRARFGHDLVRDAIYSDLPRSARVALHREAGQRLAATGAPARRIAEHLSRSAERGDQEAVAWLVRAARDAAGGSPGIAADLLGRAIDLSDPADPGQEGLLAERAATLLWAGRIPEAESVCRSLLDRSGRHEEVEATVRTLLGRCLMANGRMQEAVTELELAYNSPAASDADRAASAGAASTAHLFAGDIQAAAIAAGWSHTAARKTNTRADEPGEVGGSVLASTALKTEATVELFRGHLSRALGLVDEAVAAADVSPGRQGHRDVHRLVRGHALLELDRLPEARATLEAGMRTSEQLGVRWPLSAYQLMLAVERFTTGEWDEALAEVEAGLELSEETGERYNVVAAHAIRSVIALHRNDLVAADLATSAAEQELARSGPRYRSHWAGWSRALLCEAGGSADQGYEILSGCWDAVTAAGTVVEYPALAPDLVRWAGAVGDSGRGREVVAALESLADANDVASLTGVALRCRGLWEDDADLLRQAVDAYAGGPRPLEHALTCEDAGVLLGQRGKQAEAVELLQRALAGYDRLNADRDTARASAALRDLGVRPGPRTAHSRAQTGWDSLTSTERAVVDLAAEGLTNPQIGERLFVSRRTVQTHLGHVFAKLELSSRTELAVAVTRRDSAGRPHR